MNKSLVVASVMLVLCSCASAEPEESAKMPELEQQLLVEQLKVAQIPFRISDDGSVWYRTSLRDRVGKIQQGVLERTRPFHAVGFPSAAEADRFAELLAKRGASAKRWQDVGKHWVQWSAADEKLANEALAEHTRKAAEALNAG